MPVIAALEDPLSTDAEPASHPSHAPTGLVSRGGGATRGAR